MDRYAESSKDSFSSLNQALDEAERQFSSPQPHGRDGHIDGSMKAAWMAPCMQNKVDKAFCSDEITSPLRRRT
jgi:hypothetical protein